MGLDGFGLRSKPYFLYENIAPDDLKLIFSMKILHLMILSCANYKL